MIDDKGRLSRNSGNGRLAGQPQALLVVVIDAEFR